MSLPSQPTTGQRVMIILVALGAVGVALLLTVIIFLKHGDSNSPAAISLDPALGNSGGKTLDSLGKVNDFTLTDQAGEQAPWTRWENKIVLVDFIFTRCQGPCPRMTARMAQIQKKAKSDPAWSELKFVSICVDPDHDTPEVLRAYAKMVDADLSRWTFLTGNRDQLVETATKSFRVPVEIAPVGSNEPIMHTQKFVLVDRGGNVRGYYNGLDSEAYAKLQTDLHQLINNHDSEPGHPGPGASGTKP